MCAGAPIVHYILKIYTDNKTTHHAYVEERLRGECTIYSSFCPYYCNTHNTAFPRLAGNLSNYVGHMCFFIS